MKEAPRLLPEGDSEEPTTTISVGAESKEDPAPMVTRAMVVPDSPVEVECDSAAAAEPRAAAAASATAPTWTTSDELFGAALGSLQSSSSDSALPARTLAALTASSFTRQQQREIEAFAAALLGEAARMADAEDPIKVPLDKMGFALRAARGNCVELVPMLQDEGGHEDGVLRIYDSALLTDSWIACCPTCYNVVFFGAFIPMLALAWLLLSLAFAWMPFAIWTYTETSGVVFGEEATSINTTAANATSAATAATAAAAAAAAGTNYSQTNATTGALSRPSSPWPLEWSEACLVLNDISSIAVRHTETERQGRMS